MAASCPLYETFSAIPEATLGRPVYEMGGGRWETSALRRQLKEVLPRDRAVGGLEVTLRADAAHDEHPG